MKIHTRGSWNARTPRPRERQAAINVREMFLHYPGSLPELDHIDRDNEQDTYMRGIQDFHMDTRGWSDFAYSFAVFQDGEIYRGRGIGYKPAAQELHNSNTVAVLCVVGNDETPSTAMRKSLRSLKNYLDKKTGRDLRVRAHSEVVQTACPGPHIRALVPTLNKS